MNDDACMAFLVTKFNLVNTFGCNLAVWHINFRKVWLSLKERRDKDGLVEIAALFRAFVVFISLLYLQIIFIQNQFKMASKVRKSRTGLLLATR
jgi:hypothetical protein